MQARADKHFGDDRRLDGRGDPAGPLLFRKICRDRLDAYLRAAVTVAQRFSQVAQEPWVGEHRRGDGKRLEVESQEFRSESFEVRSERPIADLSGEAVTDECDPRQTFGQYGKEEVDLVAEDRVEHRLGQAGSAGDLFGRRGCEATTA